MDVPVNVGIQGLYSPNWGYTCGRLNLTRLDPHGA